MGRPKGSKNRSNKAAAKPSKKNIVEKKETKEVSVSVFRDIMKKAENPWSSVASEGIEAGDIIGFIDTGSLILNAAVSGKITEGGFPDNKIVVLAGEEATGKTLFVIECIVTFLNRYPNAGVYFFESESAISREMLVSRGVDTRRVFWMPVTTVQELRTQTIKILDNYIAIPENKRPKMLFVLDSLGMLSTTKEIEDTAAGKETADMTRARLIKSLFRVVTLKLGRAGVCFLVTNHTYQTQGMFSTKEMGGGSGSKYSASTVIFLSSSKDKEGQDVVGRILTATIKKSRLTKPDKKIKMAINYDSGVNKYYGLLDLGLTHGIFKKIDKRWKIGRMEAKEDVIYENPEKYFTPEIMTLLEQAAQKEYLYGSSLIKTETANAESK